MTKYLTVKEDRRKSIINDTDEKFLFEHQSIHDVDDFKNGIFENRINLNPFGIPLYLNLQDNVGAGAFVRENSDLIEAAAAEFSIDADLVKAVIYTEMARGWYDRFNPAGSLTVLPGNVSEESWADLMPDADFSKKEDNIRVTAKLLSGISKRLDVPYPEDVYSLYNGLAHDRTYENDKTKSTPYFLKKVLEEKAWLNDEWSLPNLLTPLPAAEEGPKPDEGAWLTPGHRDDTDAVERHSDAGLAGGSAFGTNQESVDRQTSYDTYQQLGATPEEEARAIEEYWELLKKSHVDMGGHAEAAEALAAWRYQWNWGLSAFGPEGTVVKHPVEKVYPDLDQDGHGYVRDGAEALLKARGVSAARWYLSANEKTGRDRRLGQMDDTGFGPRMTLSYDDADGARHVVTETFQADVHGAERRSGVKTRVGETPMPSPGNELPGAAVEAVSVPVPRAKPEVSPGP